ncbi:glucose 1-dehydrogenase [Melghirimyces profundicolus]|nr:glucose 1-dehydrogenase [Melghirimyces profundicolus]
MRFQHQAVAVTGGGQGIGRALVQYFSRKGAGVHFIDTDPEAGREWEEKLRAEGGRVWFTRADVSKEEEVRRWMEEVDAREGKLDLLCNNAGIMIRKTVEELSLEEWNRVLGVNLTGAFLCVKYAVPLLRKTDQGAILNIASTRGLMSEPDTESYSASKGGILAFTHALAVSLGPDIRVNAVSPGWIDVTPWQKTYAREPEELREVDHRQHPAGRVGRPDDIVRAAAFLASKESDFITGANLIIDGGMTVKMIYEE